MTLPALPNVETAQDFVARLDSLGYKPKAMPKGGWTAYCPAHNDGSEPGLKIDVGNTRPIVLKCHAGCSHADILRAVGSGIEAPRHLQVIRDEPPKPLGPVVAVYPYTDANGELLYEVRRHDPKTFRPYLPGARSPGLPKSTPKVLYMLPHVLAAIESGLPVHIVEGEKDANAIIDSGGVATTTFGGANKAWEDSYTKALEGARVIIVSDRDEQSESGKYPGQEKALRVLEALQDAGIVSEIVYPAHGKDAYDHLEAGLGLDEWAEFVRPIHPEPNPQLEIESKANGTLAAIHILDLADLLKNKPPDPVWTWHGYLEKGTLGLLHGDGGLGKSMIGLGLAANYVRGLDQFLDVAIGHGKALYLDAENHPREIRRRVWNFGLRTGREGLAYGRVEPAALKEDAECEEALLTVIGQTEATLLVLDSQRGLWSGDEKEAGEIRAFYNRLAHVAELADIGILLLHHDNKGGVYSGSTDQNAAVTSRIHLERKNQGRSIADRRDRSRIMYHEKNRAAEESEPVAFEIHVEHGEVSFAMIDLEDSETVKIERKRTPSADDVAGYVRAHGPEVNPGVLRAGVGAATGLVLSKDRLSKLRNSGELDAAGVERVGKSENDPHAYFQMKP